MKHCKHCNDTLFTEIYDTCMTCFEKQPTESTMTKTIDQYEGDCLWYQREINALQATVNGDRFNIKRLTEENEKLRNELDCYIKTGDVKSFAVKRQQEILDKILFELPVSNITTHTYENIPDRVKYYVREHALLESQQDEANELISQSMPNFFDHPDAGYILDNIALLIAIADKAKIEAWGDREDLEALQEEIKTCYEYYAGFGVKKDLKPAQMLNYLLKSKSAKDITSIESERDQYKAALEEIVKRPRKSETCKLIAQQALGQLADDEYQPELLIEENLALKMKIEDLQAVIDSKLLNKVFPDKVNPLMCFPDCGEYWDYHHEEHCKANL